MNISNLPDSAVEIDKEKQTEIKYTWKERLFVVLPGVTFVHGINLFFMGALPNLLAFLFGCWCGDKILSNLKNRSYEENERKRVFILIASGFLLFAFFFNVLGQQTRAKLGSAGHFVKEQNQISSKKL